MIRAARFGCMVFIALFAAVVLAQSKPDFSGNWTLVEDPNAQSGRGSASRPSVLGRGAIITQEAKWLIVTTTTAAGDVTRTFDLEGSENKSTISIDGNKLQLSKVKFHRSKLSITTTSGVNGKLFETTETWSIDRAGNLVVELEPVNTGSSYQPPSVQERYPSRVMDCTGLTLSDCPPPPPNFSLADGPRKLIYKKG